MEVMLLSDLPNCPVFFPRRSDGDIALSQLSVAVRLRAHRLMAVTYGWSQV